MSKDIKEFYEATTEPIHLWFELSYAQYLTVPRSVMQAMPHEWQVRMATCLAELDETIDWMPKEGRYWVKLKDGKGRYLSDPLQEYRHPQKDAIVFFKPDSVRPEIKKEGSV